MVEKVLNDIFYFVLRIHKLHKFVLIGFVE